MRKAIGAERPDWGEHAPEKAAALALDQGEVMEAAIGGGRVIHENTTDPRGTHLVVLVRMPDGRPVHLVVGVSRSPWKIITVWRPDEDTKGRWNADYTKRRGW